MPSIFLPLKCSLDLPYENFSLEPALSNIKNGILEGLECMSMQCYNKEFWVLMSLCQLQVYVRGPAFSCIIIASKVLVALNIK